MEDVLWTHTDCGGNRLCIVSENGDSDRSNIMMHCPSPSGVRMGSVLFSEESLLDFLLERKEQEKVLWDYADCGGSRVSIASNFIIHCYSYSGIMVGSVLFTSQAEESLLDFPLERKND